MRPTLLLKYAESTEGYLSWRWIDRLDEVEAAHLGNEVLEAVRNGLAEALPNPLPGEEPSEALTRALTVGAFSRPDTTAIICTELAQALVPQPLLAALAECPERPVVRLQASPSLGQVPWEMVMLELADVVGLPPATVRNGAGVRGRPQRSGAPRSRVVAVIDPRVPGGGTGSALGSVLGRPTADAPLAELIARHGDGLSPAVTSYPELARRRDLDRHWLHAAVADADRLLFVGHTSSAAITGAPGEKSALHLACVDPDGHHRPLTARDLLTGADTGPWTMPSRVAMIGCESGGDPRDPEGLGLTMASMALGADLVTATRWVLPTDRALAEAGGATIAGSPLQSLVLAVDAAHDADDPVDALANWRRSRAAAWQSSGTLADSPLLWGAVTTAERRTAP